MSENPIWLSAETIIRRLTVQEKVAIADDLIAVLYGKNQGEETRRKVKEIGMCAHVWVEGRK